MYLYKQHVYLANWLQLFIVVLIVVKFLTIDK